MPPLTGQRHVPATRVLRHEVVPASDVVAQSLGLSVGDEVVFVRHEGELLDIDSNGPVLTMERMAFDDSGRAFEYGHHCYRPDLYSFETTLVAK